MKYFKISTLYYVFTVALTILLLDACTNDPTKRKDFLEVMEIHDVAMAEMGTIHRLTKQLDSQIIRISSPTDSIVSVGARNALLAAEEGMMDWMASFQLPEKNSKVTQFLEKEKVKVTKVNNDIFSAIKLAERAIRKNSNK